MKGLARLLKRLFDLAVAGLAFVLFLPVMAAVALAIKLVMPGPAIFTQPRAGLRGETFKIYKFRTMSEARDAEGNLLPDADRLTSLGLWLRRLSLDELPQLLNVLRGDLSLVGPRPLLLRYLPRYNARQARRHEVPPGITGWAQVNGRNAIGWEEKFELDVWYVDHWSLWLDFKILVMTALKVFKRADISQQGHATMPEFMGSPKCE